jgi:simple sugar transport system ATP-binding protein
MNGNSTTRAKAGELVLSLRGVSKNFGAVSALNDIELDVHAGEVVALVGDNGAGKSTLVKILAGVQPADTGVIQIGGQVLRLTSPAQARKAGILSVHQSIIEGGVSNLSVAENLVLDEICGARLPLFLGPRRIRRRAVEIADRTGLAVDLSQPLSVLSLAERQLVAIARAFAGEPKLLILDEPTASLSGAEAERLFELVERVKASGIAVLFISHKLADLRRIADRAVVLRHGRVQGEFTRPLDIAAATRAMIGRQVVPTSRAQGSQIRETSLTLRSLQLRDSAPAIDLDLFSGEITVVTGPLGAGKSSLLEMLFGLRPPAAGQIVLAGRPWLPRGPADAIAAGVFMAGEDRWLTSLAPHETLGADLAGTIALPHLKHWSHVLGFLGFGREVAAAQTAIRRLGIVCRGPHDRLDHLSGGNQQKVVVARWQARPANLLLLDEPFQGVDLGARHDLIASLRAMDPSAAILIATSDVEEALEAADRILVLRDRGIAAEYRPGQEDFLARLTNLETLVAGAADR